jgi:hypothetical protein
MEAALKGPSGRTLLGTGALTIGRAADNQLVVNDSKASSHHAEMRLVEQNYTITDLSSTNGTLVNDQRLDPRVPRQLNAGDRIRIGDTLFTYEATGAAEVTPGQSSSGYQATIPAAPSEYTAYGAGAQQQYEALPQQGYTPAPQQGYPPPQQYGAFPQQAYLSPPPQQPYTPPPAYQAYTPPRVPGVVPSYVASIPQQPYTPPPAQKKPGARLLVIAIVAIVILGVVGGSIAYFLTRPQPVISVTSNYKVGAVPAGSTSTTFHVSGQKFSGNSAITFLLDGTPVPGNSSVQSDANGNVKADLTVTSVWVVGNHTLTARDAGNYTTRDGVSVTIVPQGQAHTPGPNGSPPDDMSFSLNVNVQAQDAVTGKQQTPLSETLMITGRPDPAGGTVCRSADNGQPQVLTGNSSNNTTYRETLVWTCSGTYKGGKLTYTETATSDKIDFSNGVSCVARTPYVAEHLEGTFTGNNTASGSYSSDGITADCNQGLGAQQFDASKGSWTGTV